MTQPSIHKEYKLHYTAPAKDWNEAIPLGNGRIGAMVYGHVTHERYQLNEDTFWSGFPRDTNNYEAIRYLKKARHHIEQKQYHEAEALIQNKMLAVNPQAYQPFVDLWLRLQCGDEDVLEYERTLQLNQAIASSIAVINGMTIRKESWISKPGQVMVINISSDLAKSLTLELELTSPHPYKTIPKEYVSIGFNAPTHIADNWMQDHPLSVQYEDGKGIRANCMISALSDGKVSYSNNKIEVERATTVTFYVALKTSFISFLEMPHQDDQLLMQANKTTLSNALNLPYEQLKQQHLMDYQSLFNRTSFSLTSPTSSHSDHQHELPLPDRLARYREGQQDLNLEELYFHYGKYLIISSSRETTQASNLQGIWNEHIQPPWFSDYTLNINTEMNYWPVEALALTECVEPLHRFIEELSITGTRTARIHYNARGWTAHHNSDIWRMSSPTSGSPSWAFWPLAGVWLSQHLWEHYLYHQDETYLREKAYPILRQAACFALDLLVEDNNGTFLTNPSTSPENMFLYDGQPCSVAKGSTMDLTLIRELFEHCIEASRILDVNDEVIKEIKVALGKLAIPQLTDDGRILEWFEPFDEAEKGHRHVSHLYGIYPGTTLLAHNTEHYSEAARRSLDYRIAHGGGHTGWSCAWLINLFARLKDGEQAYHYVQQLLMRSTYNNLFDAHPPFQIDGNFGGVAGMLEMIVQSHLNTVTLLPAVPQAWSSGYIKGIKLRGGFTLEMSWSNHELDYAILTSAVHTALNLNGTQHYNVQELETNCTFTHIAPIPINPLYQYRITPKSMEA